MLCCTCVCCALADETVTVAWLCVCVCRRSVCALPACPIQVRQLSEVQVRQLEGDQAAAVEREDFEAAAVLDEQLQVCLVGMKRACGRRCFVACVYVCWGGECGVLEAAAVLDEQLQVRLDVCVRDVGGCAVCWVVLQGCEPYCHVPDPTLTHCAS